jgi:RNA polymerase sigma-70 factor (ECF subfamily)
VSVRPCTSRLNQHLRAIAGGDPRALEALYADTSPLLFAVAIRFMGRGDAAEDLLQDFYLSVWRKADQFDPERGDPMGWLHVVLRNKALDVLRRRPLRREDPLPDVEALVDPGPSPLAALEQKTFCEHLQRDLDRLRPDHARALRSIYFEGLSYPQLAEREQIPLPTAKSWVQRSVTKLRSFQPVDDADTLDTSDADRPAPPSAVRPSAAN